MKITVAKHVVFNVCEPPYLTKALNNLLLSDDYHFIISRLNTTYEINATEALLEDGKKNILIMLSDEAGIIPPNIDKYFLVFRTYARKSLLSGKIHPIPCGFSCSYGGYFGKNDWLYDDMEKPKKNLIDREFDIFYSGQVSPNRLSFINQINNIKNNFNSKIKLTSGFASGFELNDYYSMMQNSKIALVPNGAVVPESFRYFEAVESNCIIITSYPVKNNEFNHWFYEGSTAIFLNDWKELNVDLIQSLLKKETLEEYNIKNREYFENKISTKALSEYMLKTIQQKNN
jgi:hypothetical protein